MIANHAQTLAETSLEGVRVLIVDDERATRHSLTDLFERLGCETRGAAHGLEALELVCHQNFDLVILDLKMPAMDGTEVLERARQLAPETVYIIMTAYGTLDSAITALRQGASDYLLKPSSLKEIVRAAQQGLAVRQARLQKQNPITLLEQALDHLKATAQGAARPQPAKRFLQTPDVTVDVRKRLVSVRGEPVDLTPTEFDALVYLMRHRDRIVSCRELVAEIRGYELDERDAATFMRAHIHRLRGKIEVDPSQPQLIQTVRGSGYLFASNGDNKLGIKSHDN